MGQTDGLRYCLMPPHGGDIKMGGNFSSILTQGGRPFLVVGDYGSAEF